MNIKSEKEEITSTYTRVKYTCSDGSIFYNAEHAFRRESNIQFENFKKSTKKIYCSFPETSIYDYWYLLRDYNDVDILREYTLNNYFYAEQRTEPGIYVSFYYDDDRMYVIYANDVLEEFAKLVEAVKTGV